MTVKHIVTTPNAEATMAYIARVSSPNQENPNYSGLLKYCLDHQHWSVFEHAHMTLEIATSRMISAQILRHRSFTFSEFSQRYAEPMDYVPVKARRQAEKNRQSSVDDFGEAEQKLWYDIQDSYWRAARGMYEAVVKAGIAKECARAILPMNTATRLYMTGSVRSWIHYIQLRTEPDTQKEHRDIAMACEKIFCRELPTVAEALGWK